MSPGSRNWFRSPGMRNGRWETELSRKPPIAMGSPLLAIERMLRKTGETTNMTGDKADQIDALRQEAAGCRACPLWKNATQTVFGEGPADADIVFVGEQPGDREDRAGHPFVGPAGSLLDKALAEAGVDRTRAYVTNAVKHFKFEPRGKLRLHKKPNASEVKACKRWLFSEIDVLQPRLVVALGATAAQSLAGRPVPIIANRGETLSLANGLIVFVTVHPSSLLRVPDKADKETAYAEFVKDLRAVGALAAKGLRESAPRALST
ncbi:MAG: UdgX family uracil-DNA binding protein [Hyphomicrobiales bacterium]|nr:UdgX family uracil-DNA binding protein [Hyphomicrobiales bacterium]